MSKIVNMFEHLSFFAGISVVATTIITIVLFKLYAEKQLLSNEGTEGQNSSEGINNWWYLGVFVSELGSQFTIEQYLDFGDAIITTISNVIGNAILFFICYGILSVVGVNKDNKYERCNKAFMGLVIISWALLLLIDYAMRNGF